MTSKTPINGDNEDLDGKWFGRTRGSESTTEEKNVGTSFSSSLWRKFMRIEEEIEYLFFLHAASVPVQSITDMSG